MQKELIKLALTGITAGLCLSLQNAQGEIAMSKCSRPPPSPKQMQQRQAPENEGDVLEDNTLDDESSCSNYCGNQGDQSSENDEMKQNKRQTKRLSAAKAAMGEERMPKVDK